MSALTAAAWLSGIAAALLAAFLLLIAAAVLEVQGLGRSKRAWVLVVGGLAWLIVVGAMLLYLPIGLAL